MNVKIIGSLNHLCNRAETLQFHLSKHRHKGNENRQLYEAVAKAKDKLLEALRIAEGM